MSPTRLALLELACTVALPVLILQVGLNWFGPVTTVFVAGAPAAAFLVFQMARERTVSALGVIGLVGVGLSGGIGLLRLDAGWFAVKEALVPLVFGAALAISAFGPWSPIHLVLDRLLAPEPWARVKEDPARRARLDAAMRRSTLEAAVVTALPGILAFFLARWTVVSPTGTEAWAAEMRDYSGLSLPAVTGPAVVLLWYWARRMFDRIEDAIGVGLETLLPDP